MSDLNSIDMAAPMKVQLQSQVGITVDLEGSSDHVIPCLLAVLGWVDKRVNQNVAIMTEARQQGGGH